MQSVEYSGVQCSAVESVECSGVEWRTVEYSRVQ